MSSVLDIIEHLEMLKEDADTGKRLRERMDVIIELLRAEGEHSITKALHALEEMNTLQLPAYHRTQVWELASMLEELQ